MFSAAIPAMGLAVVSANTIFSFFLLVAGYIININDLAIYISWFRHGLCMSLLVSDRRSQ